MVDVDSAIEFVLYAAKRTKANLTEKINDIIIKYLTP